MTNVPDLNNIPEDFKKKMEFFEHYTSTDLPPSHPTIPCTYFITLDRKSGKPLSLEGPCGCWPNHHEIDAMIALLNKIRSLSKEQIDLHNRVRETQAYEDMIDVMMSTTSTKKKQTKSGYVYLINDGHGNIKIGRTVNWERRYHSPEFGPKTRVELVISTDDYVKTEKFLHETFSSKHIQGEWFQLNADDIDSVEQEFNGHIVHRGE